MARHEYHEYPGRPDSNEYSPSSNPDPNSTHGDILTPYPDTHSAYPTSPWRSWYGPGI